ncbi:hypothetical protein CAPTEDRAFT_212428 [Capitella teleta]|uniref:ADP,ATP carrier protein n=1 Tax=Capitella teleta TaxID=283909 RepID=R7UG02_CAPTE|nr:hypothetical protein CAPTEDRAFT_212428 [Capitella teleta]|eukprot:ELU02217.1 hypothetical protein CAPTEDRAFT_212428 [Capitella teleta]
MKNVQSNIAQNAIKAEKRKIIKNVLLVSLSFLLTFAAFLELRRLQSSLNRVDGLGVINTTIMCASLVMTCLFVPKMMTTRVGPKWTMSLSFCGYIIWIAVNGYAQWYTMVPASIVAGICIVPLWTAQSEYFTKMAEKYADLNQENKQDVMGRFFVYFFMCFQMANIFGSGISSTLLNPTQIPDNNATFSSEGVHSSDIQSRCSANDFPSASSAIYDMPNFSHPPSETVRYANSKFHLIEFYQKVWTMVGIYTAGAIVAVLIVDMFVDRIPKCMQLYGSMFERESEPALWNYSIWQSIGFMVANACSIFIAWRIKIISLLIMLFVGNAFYLVVEIESRKYVNRNQIKEPEKS